MTFLNLSLLAGSALIAIPIVLHLIMRQKPKLLEFPALRFIQKRHETNQRKLRLRHILLLLMRAGGIALLSFALARPSMTFSDWFGSQEAPVAAALVFDTAPHMHYRHENKTRLEVARGLGQWLLSQLPQESQIAVLDSGPETRGFDADRGLSRQRIERLEVINQSLPLARVVGEAARVLTQSKLPRKEIYVFTDLSRSAWPADSAAALQDRLSEAVGVAVYVIDVGVTAPTDFALGDVHLPQQVLAAGSSMGVRTEVTCVGPGGQRTVELELAAPGGKMQLVRETTVPLKDKETKPVEFLLSTLKPGMYQGYFKIKGEDGLAADDVRHFTFSVRPAWPVLVVAPRPAPEKAFFFTPAIAPPGTDAQYKCQVVDYTQLSQQELKKFSAVCLLDPPPLEAGDWQALANYAGEGHGVAVFLGRSAQPIDSFNTPAAQQVLPGLLRMQARRADGDTWLAPQNFQHPILKAFASRATTTPWDAFPVFRYWDLSDSPSGSGVATVIPYNDGRPAMLERTIGLGRVLVMTTPIPDRANRDAWNWLPFDGNAKAWPYVMLARQMMAYLVGSGEQQLNYVAGDTVRLTVDEKGRGRTYVLASPDGTKSSLPPLEKQDLVVSSAEQVGNYLVQGAGLAASEDLGFSVNLPPRQTQLQRVSEAELNAVFGPFKYRMAMTAEQIDRSVAQGRVGRELFPGLILILAVVLSLEYMVANRFYREA